MEAALSALARVVHGGEAMLFTGAGFSADACDLDGACLPDSAQMVRELWPLVFEGGAPDDSTLADLYDCALARAPDALRSYVDRRLRIGHGALPAYYAAWFSAPWRRIYTLNVDDLEVAVQRQYRLPRPLRSVSAIAPVRADVAPPAPGAVDVVHLNGLAGDDARDLTFSTMQYAARLCGRDREYERLAADLERAPFVFVGTRLDEVILWQHLELRRGRTAPVDASVPHPSFLITPALSRARQLLLATQQIEWIPATLAQVAAAILRS